MINSLFLISDFKFSYGMKDTVAHLSVGWVVADLASKLSCLTWVMTRCSGVVDLAFLVWARIPC